MQNLMFGSTLWKTAMGSRQSAIKFCSKVLAYCGGTTMEPAKSAKVFDTSKLKWNTHLTLTLLFQPLEEAFSKVRYFLWEYEVIYDSTSTPTLLLTLAFAAVPLQTVWVTSNMQGIVLSWSCNKCMYIKVYFISYFL